MIIIYIQPSNFALEKTTIWSFKERGDWATHSGEYRGNWSPYVPRNLILRYTKPGEWVLDQFVGSGTTLVEAKLLNRHAIGLDINNKAINLAKKKLQISFDSISQIFVKQGDAANLSSIKTNGIDFVCTHPPYADIIKYSQDIPEDISYLSLSDFLERMSLVAQEAYRVLKPNHYCAVMMGDIRRKGKIFPLGFEVMKIFLEQNFHSQEIIIKEQHNCRSTDYWCERNLQFLLLAHEYIFVFQK